MSGMVVASVGSGGGAALLGPAALAVVAVAVPIVAVRAAVLVGAEVTRQWRDIATRERTATQARRAEIVAAIGRQEATALVVETNAAIAVLAATADRHHADVPVPRPLRIADQPEAELRAWCASTSVVLRELEPRLARLAGTAYARNLLSSLRIHEPDGPSEGPDGRRPATPHHPAPSVRSTAAAGGYVPGADILADLSRVVGRLDPLVSEVDVVRVHAAAAALASAPTHDDARNGLTEVRIRVQEANAQAARQRDDALQSARMLQALADRVDGEAEAIRQELTSVLVGAPMAAELRTAAMALIQRAAQEDAQRYFREQLVAALDELDYDMLGGFETLAPGKERMMLARPGWRQHAVQVVLDHDARELRAAVVRTAARSTEEHRNMDAEREQQWCETYADIRQLLADVGIRLQETLQVEPGMHELPVIEARVANSSTVDEHRAAVNRPRQRTAGGDA